MIFINSGTPIYQAIAEEDFLLNDPVIIEIEYINKAPRCRRAKYSDDLDNICYVLEAAKAGDIAKLAHKDTIFNIEK